MSAFYDQASLVLVPSGYKSGKIYAQKPLTTDGQLTFTRASTATRVNASGLIEAVASGVPRLDYLGSSCPKLQLEPQRSNLALRSEAFDDAAWTKAGTTITANDATSPDGSTNADRLVETATTATHLVFQSVVLTAATHTFSCFIKAVSGSTRNVGLLFNLTGKGVIVNPSTGAVVAYFGTTASDIKIETYPNGWYRVSVTATTAAITESMRIYLADGTTWTAPYAGDGTSSALIWGAMLEQGAYPTSYVKTEAAAVTRLADAASKTGISSLLGGTQGTLMVEVDYRPIASTASTVFGAFNSIGGALGFASTGVNTLRVKVNAVNDIINTINPLLRHKAALAFNASGVVCYVNGSPITLTNCGSQVVSGLDEFILQASTRFNELDIYQVYYSKTRLTNAQLAELTTL
jgi:hypothetical protein